MSANTPVMADFNRVLSRLHLCIYPDLILRQNCVPVERFDSALRDLVGELRLMMRTCLGIGLAAPQAGITESLFVAEIGGRALCLANPRIINADGHDEQLEGCLSLPGFQYQVSRHRRLVVSGFDEHGRKKKMGLTGLWARVAQHEMDHLKGVLICDRGTPLEAACGGCPLLDGSFAAPGWSSRKVLQ